MVSPFRIEFSRIFTSTVSPFFAAMLRGYSKRTHRRAQVSSHSELCERRILLSADSLDNSFGVGGRVVTDFTGLDGSEDTLTAVKSVTGGKTVAVGNDGNIFAIERTANTNEIALQLAASELSDAADKAKTNEQVWNLMNAFFEEVQQYGVHYYAGKD